MPQNWPITGTSGGFGRILTELALERSDDVVPARELGWRAVVEPTENQILCPLTPVLAKHEVVGFENRLPAPTKRVGPG